MHIKIDKATFDSLPVDAVGHACFAPMVQPYQEAMRAQGGQMAQEVRAAFYQSLLPGQRALFMFFSYYDHAVRSPDEFERISRHYLSAQIFGAVKKGVEYFCDDAMLRFLSEAEQALTANGPNKTPALYRRFREISPGTLERIGTRIKGDHTAFVCFEQGIASREKTGE